MINNNKTLIGEETYLKIKETINENAKEIVSSDDLEVFNQHIGEKLADFNPSMMVYGTYNAGKSSLLNALFGQAEKAKTGDSPETAEVHAYQYNGYTIYDTPGINAPVEHEKVTNDHLKKTEMVLFVMSNDGSLEEEYVYERISEIVKSNKPLIIVLNNKRGIDINSKEAIDEINKVNYNLSKIGDRNGIDKIEDKVRLCMVNAKSGLKGKLEDKKLILKKSNLLKLEALIYTTLLESGSKDVINALNTYTKDFIGSVISNIDSKVNNVHTKKLEELITSLQKLKKSSSVKLTNLVDKQMIRLSGDLEPLLLKGGDDIKNNIQSSIKENVNRVVVSAETEFQKIDSELKTKINDFSIEFKEISANYFGSVPENESESSSDPFLPPEIGGKIKEVLSNPKVVEEGTRKVLVLAKEWLPKAVMHGKGPVWIGKVAGKAGPIITVAVEAYGMINAYKDHKKMIEEERSKAISARNMANNIADEVKTELNSSLNENLSIVFDDLIIRFRKESEQLDKKNQDLFKYKRSLNSVLSQIY